MWNQSSQWLIFMWSFSSHNFEIVTVIERDSAWLGSGAHPAAWIQSVRLWQTNFGHGQGNIYRTPVSNCLNHVRQHLWLEAFCLQPRTLFSQPHPTRQPSQTHPYSLAYPPPLFLPSVCSFWLFVFWLSVITSSTDHKVEERMNNMCCTPEKHTLLRWGAPRTGFLSV